MWLNSVTSAIPVDVDESLVSTMFKPLIFVKFMASVTSVSSVDKSLINVLFTERLKAIALLIPITVQV